jgi:predicted phosphodiesterase
MQLAIISDIHGNSWALQEVLSDIRKRGIQTILNLGDSLYGPLDPAGTFELLRQNHVTSISGNEDRLLINHDETAEDSRVLRYVLSRIGPVILQWLSGLPADLVFNRAVYACHGIPGNDSVYLLETPVSGALALRPEEDIQELVCGIGQNMIVCGHSHLPRTIRTGERIIINPGSVGCPAFDDDQPVYHKVDTGDNMARYALLDTGSGIPVPVHISVPYDFIEAASCARKNGFPDWGYWLSTGTTRFTSLTESRIIGF